MSRILVLGARGQVGRHLCAQGGRHVRGVDSSELNFTSVDLPEMFEALLAAEKPSCIINMAAYTDVVGAEQDEACAMHINAHAVQQLVHVARSHNLPLIHGSTDYVFNGRKDEPYSETDTTAPLSAYGRSKRAGEQAVLAYDRGYVLRYSWVFNSAGKNFLTTMAALMAKAQHLRIVADQIGAPSYAGDLARATFQFTENLPLPGIYHTCASGHTSWHGFARAIAGALGHTSLAIEPILASEYGGNVQRPANSRLNTAKLAACGITLPHWRDGLARAVAAMVATNA